MLKMFGLENYGLFEMLGLITVIVIGEYFLIDYLSPNLFPDIGKKWKRWRRKKRLLKNATFTISEAVWDYAKKNSPALMAKWGEGSGKLSYEKFRMRMHIISDVLPKISEWQDLFDQVLKMRAESLQSVYTLESSPKPKNRDLRGDALNFFSRAEIDALLWAETTRKKIKEEVERDFWNLHDTLQYLGLETWGSYKLYLKLKPDHDLPILKQ